MKKIIFIDLLIGIISMGYCVYIYLNWQDSNSKQFWILVLFSMGVICLIDIFRKTNKKEVPVHKTSEGELTLLDENGREIKKWDLAGKASIIIGRENKEENIDIDLSDCEYNALVDYQHALLNYACGNWYIEDLYSKNGIRIRKNKDGSCYNVAKDRPCRLEVGDVILVANTPLLFK